MKKGVLRITIYVIDYNLENEKHMKNSFSRKQTDEIVKLIKDF